MCNFCRVRSLLSTRAVQHTAFKPLSLGHLQESNTVFVLRIMTEHLTNGRCVSETPRQHSESPSQSAPVTLLAKPPGPRLSNACLLHHECIQWLKICPHLSYFGKTKQWRQGHNSARTKTPEPIFFSRLQRQCKLFGAQPPILACGGFRGCPRRLCTGPAASLKRKGDRLTPQTHTGSHQEEETATNRPSTQASNRGDRTALHFRLLAVLTGWSLEPRCGAQHLSVVSDPGLLEENPALASTRLARGRLCIGFVLDLACDVF